MSGDISQSYKGPSDNAGPPRVGGFSRCPRSCVECKGSPHHFSEMLIEFADEENADHEAAKIGVDSWWQCKHCDSWIECTGDEDLDEGPDVSLLAPLPAPPPYKPRERPKLLAEVHPASVCKCGHRADSHLPDLPSPCGHGRTMRDCEIIARCMDPDLTKDPRYGCRCIAFSPGAPS